MFGYERKNRVKIFCIVVIYNSEVVNSITVRNLTKLVNDDFVILVADNSSENYLESNERYCRDNGIVHLIMEGNLGLSVATNRALDYIDGNDVNNDDIVITLNDDTAIDEKYIEILKKNVVDNPNIDIFVPYMQGQNRILYSPAKKGFFKNHYLNTMEQEIPQNKFFAIYSGCSCRWGVYIDYRFDENIFMDLIDTNFCDDQRMLGKKFKKIDYIIQQNYALKNKGLSANTVKHRMMIWIPDFFQYCKKKKVRLLGFIPSIFAHGIMYAIKTRSIRILFWMIGRGYYILFTGRKYNE